MYDALETLDVDRLVEYVAGLQRPDGSFQGDAWGEVDTRFSFCAVACLSLLVSHRPVAVPRRYMVLATRVPTTAQDRVAINELYVTETYGYLERFTK